MRLLLSTLLCLTLLPAVALAQQEDERLPDLTPREFEIRGELQVSLPDLERQPLRGFAPPPRTYIVPADRQAFIAPYGQRLDDLPEYLLQPAAPPTLMRAEPRTGQIDLLAGRYTGRRAGVTVNLGGLGVDFDYRGYSDFNGTPDASADADEMRGRVSFTGGDRLRYDFGVDGRYYQYGLFNAYHFADNDRSLRALGADARFAGSVALGLPFTARARYETARVRDGGSFLRFPDGLTIMLLQPEESRLQVGGQMRAGTARVDANVGLSSLEQGPAAEVPDGVSRFTYSAGAAAAVDIGRGELALGGRILGYSSDLDDDDGLRTIAPIVEFEIGLTDAGRFYAHNRPEVFDRGLVDLYRRNPYTQLSAIPRPDVIPINAEVGVEFQAGFMRIRGYAGGTYAQDALFFEQGTFFCPGCVIIRPLFRTAYHDQRTFRFGGDATIYASGNISISLGAELRNARFVGDLDDRPLGGEPVPYVAPLTGRASVAIPFAQDRGMIQSVLYLEGPRPTENPDEDAPRWADLSVEAHYRLAGRFGLLGRIDNLAGRAEQWPGFPRPPVMVTAGLRAGW